MTLPNFLVIGAAKAGTTSLHQYLKQHPQIFMPEIKELNFFGNEGKYCKRTGQAYTLEEYTKHFPDVKGKKAIGEVNGRYMINPESPPSIYRYIPRAKLIAILRDPVELLYSFHKMNRRNKGRPLDFRLEIFRNDGGRLRAGFYFEQLSRYYEIFEKRQIRVFLYEEMARDPKCILKKIFGFLGVDTDFAPDCSKIFWKSEIQQMPRSADLEYFLLKPGSPFKDALKKVFPMSALKKIKDLLRKMNTIDFGERVQPPPMDKKTRKLFLDIYREDIEKLQGLIGRDLSRWLEI